MDFLAICLLMAYTNHIWVITIEIIDQRGEGAEEDLVGEGIQEDGKCTEPHVPNAVKTVKSRFVQAVKDRSIAATVLIGEETKTAIPGIQADETSVDRTLRKDDPTHRIAVQIHEAQTAAS